MEYLTPDGLEQLERELEILRKIKRSEIAKRLREAASFGDLSENAEYVEVKEEQAFVESRIDELESVLREAKLVKNVASRDIAQVGCAVELSVGKHAREFVLVGMEEADPLNGKVSPESPIGRAVLGKKLGEFVIVATPKGNKKYKITKIS